MDDKEKRAFVKRMREAKEKKNYGIAKKSPPPLKYKKISGDGKSWKIRSLGMTQDQRTAEIEKDIRQHMKWKEAKKKYGNKTVDIYQFYFNVSPRMAKQLGLPKSAPR